MSINSNSTKSLVPCVQKSKKYFKSKDSKRLEETLKNRKWTRIDNLDMFSGWNSKRDKSLTVGSMLLHNSSILQTSTTTKDHLFNKEALDKMRFPNNLSQVLINLLMSLMICLPPTSRPLLR